MFSNEASRFTYTEKEFAEAVGLSIAFVRELRRQGRIPHCRVGARVLYLRDDAKKFIEQHRQSVAEEAA